MATWPALDEELNAWSASGREATLWWRDDDATQPAPALERLVGIAASNGVPLCLAVIPALAQPELRALADAAKGVTFAIHGVTHENFAAPGEKKCELLEGRPPQEMASQIAQGLETLTALAGERTVPVLVPPWNRIAETLIPLLPENGFRGLSTHGARRTSTPAPGLLQVNCHVDPIDWRGDRGFIGTGAALDMLIGHLTRRRLGHADVDEPTGLLTHHAIWTDEAFVFLEEIFARTRKHPAVRWLAPRDVFGLQT